MATLTQLNLYPIKSCGGLLLNEATIAHSGLVSGLLHDRQWMVVDAAGVYVTQRTCPQMARIRPRLAGHALEISVPGQPSIEIALALPEAESARTLDVQIWGDQVKANDCGDHVARWFSLVLGMPCRLVRFPPKAQRNADPQWTGGTNATTMFSDGFPILVISEASLSDLNGRLTQQGRAALPMNRFRPNIVIDGVEAFYEDYAATIVIGDLVLKPVKPCPRCPIPSVDQASGQIGPDPLDILRTYRVNAKVNGGITFGMNALVHAGAGARLHIGQAVELTLDF